MLSVGVFIKCIYMLQPFRISKKNVLKFQIQKSESKNTMKLQHVKKHYYNWKHPFKYGLHTSIVIYAINNENKNVFRVHSCFFVRNDLFETCNIFFLYYHLSHTYIYKIHWAFRKTYFLFPTNSTRNPFFAKNNFFFLFA